MKKIYLFLAFIFLGLFFTSCFKDEEKDKETIVDMTIYPETGYGSSVMSDLWTQPLLFSDSEDNRKQMLVDIITEGFDFEYKRGYKYILKVKKVWMHEPLQDVSSVKYVFIDLISTAKVITKDSEENIDLFVSSETVKFTPKYPSEYEEDESPKVYNALHVKEIESGNWMALTHIEGFDFEKGYEYVLDVKKVTQAEPYLLRYVLVDIKLKTKKD